MTQTEGGGSASSKGTDSKGNKVEVVAVVSGGKVVTSAVRSTGNAEQDQEKARRAASTHTEDSDHLKSILEGGS